MSKPIYYKNWDELPVSLTLADCAIILQMDYDTIRKKARAGKFPPAKKLDGCNVWRVDKDVLRDYVRGNVKA